MVNASTFSKSCHQFSFAEIRSATNDFDEELFIGEGGFGKVYKGRIRIQETSHVVAIKRLDSMSNQGAAEFKAEIETLSKLRHCHLVSLIGFCEHNKEMILMYEYMPNGTLDHHLHKIGTPLSWMQRLKIAKGAAQGLDYLHSGVDTQHGVIHRDIKSSNILLDENWGSMISDFGLSKLAANQSKSCVDTCSVKGTFGYLDPEYFYTRILTAKTDVFAFGVLLFELLSGRQAVDIRYGEEQCSLVKWAQKCVKDRKLDQLVDSKIMGTIRPKCLRRFAQIADRCLHSVPKERPSMTEVVASLDVLLTLQEEHNESGKIGFARKIQNYFVPATKQNSDLLSPEPETVGVSHDAIEMESCEPATNEEVHKIREMKMKGIFDNFDKDRDGLLSRVEAGLAFNIQIPDRYILPSRQEKYSDIVQKYSDIVEKYSDIVDKVFIKYDEFVIHGKGLTYEGFVRFYDDCGNDVDRDFEILGLKLKPDDDDYNNKANKLRSWSLRKYPDFHDNSGGPRISLERVHS